MRVLLVGTMLVLLAPSALVAGVGAESRTRTPVRLEFRTTIVPQNHFLLDKTQVEMQARVTILLSPKR